MGNYCEGGREPKQHLQRSIRVSKFYLDKYQTVVKYHYHTVKDQARDRYEELSFDYSLKKQESLIGNARVQKLAHIP